jgi:hypothetical protein
VHLTASGYPADPLCSLRSRFENPPDREDDAVPPGLRALLRPGEPRNDLLILFGGERKNGSRNAHESGPGAPGSDVDRQQQILHHILTVISARSSAADCAHIRPQNTPKWNFIENEPCRQSKTYGLDRSQNFPAQRKNDPSC